MKSVQFTVLVVICMLFGMQSCFYRQYDEPEQSDAEERQDSLVLSHARPYTVGFNFVVKADRLSLCTEIPSRAQQLSVMPDSVVVCEDDEIIVVQVENVPEDVLDSVWIKVARDQETQGWVRESLLLPSVVPDDPISLAISVFSGNHVWGACVLGGASLLLLLCLHRRRLLWTTSSLLMVRSPFPLLLGLCMGGSAVFYSSIQLFVPQVWTDFYFHPTLNPFAVPPLLGAFLLSFWLLVLFLIAAIDDAVRQLRFLQAVLFVFSILTWMSVLYIFFSLTTLAYWGYPLYALFVVLSVWAYFRFARPRFRCGICGRPLRGKGVCPYCGTFNS